MREAALPLPAGNGQGNGRSKNISWLSGMIRIQFRLYRTYFSQNVIARRYYRRIACQKSKTECIFERRRPRTRPEHGKLLRRYFSPAPRAERASGKPGVREGAAWNGERKSNGGCDDDGERRGLKNAAGNHANCGGRRAGRADPMKAPGGQ